MDVGTPFGKLVESLRSKEVYFFLLDSRLLFLVIFWSGSGGLGLQSKEFGRGCIAKFNFQGSWNSDDLIIDFDCFGWP